MIDYLIDSMCIFVQGTIGGILWTLIVIIFLLILIGIGDAIKHMKKKEKVKALKKFTSDEPPPFPTKHNPPVLAGTPVKLDEYRKKEVKKDEL